MIPRAMKINCKEASRLISRAMDERLPLWQRAKLRLHLAICDACASFNRNMQVLRRAVARLLDGR
jgi:Putative zinc-finger